ncbi:MAG: Smr/MutS family protein [Oscillospiraceae bacterium]|nr:Smr/MutS family protein [Oscillospiraceae bacterium]
MPIRAVDIKSDLPTSDLAIRRVTYVLATARAAGEPAVKLIHGYGSTGKGGRIRVELRRYLEEQRRKGKIQAFLCGESFSIFDQATLRAFHQCPALRQDSDLERHNNGITIVIL